MLLVSSCCDASYLGSEVDPICYECREHCELYDGEKPMDDLFDYMVDNAIATKVELQLVASAFGYTQENLDRVLFALTGYRSLKQIQEMEDAELGL